MDKVNQNTGLKMVMTKKEWRWIMRRHSHMMTHTMTDNWLRSQSEIDQEGRHQVEELIAYNQL